MQWIKASERLPGWNVVVKWKMNPNHPIQETTPKQMLGWASMFLTTLEWLDESIPESTDNTTIDSTRVKEAGERMKLVLAIETAMENMILGNGQEAYKNLADALPQTRSSLSKNTDH